jgi:Acyclic terpene utilisation family protein AtuA
VTPALPNRIKLPHVTDLDAKLALGINYAMGKILECGAQCSIPKSREALAIVTDDYVDVMALDPKSHMTTVSVASHFLYEKSRPDILKGPSGALHLADATYEQIAYNHVRVRGARFEPEPEGKHTLKLEAARTIGYYTAVIGAFRDPILISQLDSIISTLEGFVKEKMGDTPFDLKIHRYGINGVMGALEPDTSIPKEVCVVVQARAETQQLANQIASGCKFGFCHIGYPGQLATAGNFAWPFTPCEMPAGPLAEFCIYHLMHNSDAVALCPIEARTIEGTNTYVLPAGKISPSCPPA